MAVQGFNVDKRSTETEFSPDQLKALKLFKKGQNALGRGKIREAAKLVLKGLKFDKNSVYGMKLLAEALAKMGRSRVAIQTYEHALELAPDDMEIHFGLGNLAMSMEMNEVAANFFEIYTKNWPNDPAGYNNLATAWRNLERFDDVVTLMQSVIPLHPTSSQLWNTLAAAIYYRDGMDTAIPFYEEALRLDPNSAMALNNLAKCMEFIGEFDRAIELSKRAIKADKQLTEPRMVLANCQLAVGDLEEGWKNYTVRFDPRRTGTTFYTHGLPEWQGEDISDKTILVCPEQGIGDEIIFSNAFGELVERAGKCLIGCDKRLIPLFSRTFPSAEVGAYVDQSIDAHRVRSMPFAEGDGAPHVDYAVPAADVLKFFRPTTESFPERTGFLKPDPERVTYWKKRLDTLGPGPKVGIAWRTGRKSADRNRYHCPFDLWGPILGAEGVQFVNLQYDDCKDELDMARERFGVDVHSFDDINLKDDIDDVAALTAALDLVISSATAVAAMALATGTETWILWITRAWAYGRGDRTPISSNNRYFIWPKGGGWPETIANIADALTEYTGGQGTAA